MGESPWGVGQQQIRGTVGLEMLVSRILAPTFASCPRFFSSASEARDALDHVSEGEKKTKGLDRNRDGTLRLSFAIVSPEDAEVVHRLLYATHYPTEPLIDHGGLCTGLKSIPDLDKVVEERLASNLTLVAFDESGRPVGAAVNNVCHKNEVLVSLDNELKEIKDSQYKPIRAIQHQIRRQNGDVFDQIGIEKMFSIGMIGVETTGLGIATNLIRRSVLLAGCLGFRGINASAPGAFSREAFERVGFLAGGAIDYNSFEFYGEKVFQGLESGDSELTFMRKKFFQSSLKHIL